MAKNKKKKNRNELSIFEDFRLKPDDYRDKPPKYNDLYRMDDIYFYYNNKFKKNTYWLLTKPKYTQVNEYRVGIEEWDDDYQPNIPKRSLLKKYKTDVLMNVEEETEDGPLCTWWKENENGELIQVNVTEEEDAGVEFKVKSWLRNEAINAVSFEIRSMKKKAYEYSEDQLMTMIEAEEKKLIKKKGWQAVKVAALSALGISWLPFI